MGGRLARLILTRKLYAYGKQKDYFDAADCIGWTRSGDKDVKEGGGSGVAVVINSSWEHRSKKMFVGGGCKGEKWTDVLGWSWGEVGIDQFGEGTFTVGPRSIGVWVKEGARGRGKVDGLVLDRMVDEV
jgi:alpha-amylase